MCNRLWFSESDKEEVDQFKYLGSTRTEDGTSVKEVKIRLSQANSAMTRLAILRKNKAISLPTKIILYRSLVSVGAPL